MRLICYLILLALLNSVGSCIPRCEEAEHLENSGLGLNLIDANTGKNLYLQEGPSRYNKEDLRVSDAFGNDLKVLFQLDFDQNTGLMYYRPSIYPIFNQQTDQAAFSQEITKKIYLNFNQHVTDSLITTFKAEKTDCGSRFKALKVYHNASLIKEPVTIFDVITITIN